MNGPQSAEATDEKRRFSLKTRPLKSGQLIATGVTCLAGSPEKQSDQSSAHTAADQHRMSRPGL